MVWTHEPQKPFLLRIMSPKGSKMAPELLSLLDKFEETLETRIRDLIPTTGKDSFGLSWMSSAIETLCGIHSDILNFITAIDLPVPNWDDKWIDVYLENSVKLLDICNAFSSEISHLKQGNLFLQCALHNLNGAATENQLSRACSSLEQWKHHVSKKNPRLNNCFYVIDHLIRVLDQPKVKNSTKGKILMRAMYGAKVVTLSICSTFAAAFSGSSAKLMDLQVSETYLWAGTFAEFLTSANMEMRKRGSAGVLREVEAVDSSIENLTNSRGPTSISAELRETSEKLSEELYLVGEGVDRFFRVVLNGRDILLSNMKVGDGFKAVNKMGRSPMVR
ncbi:hypothetical protein M569_09047 [Genlisea aurea]|uniref:Protein BPS1, chloroplastic n=1 Tax=Genlisea aurea TaxID=192259 RepID=S8CFN0_9LAMI|nr:hypothetical protein M569_09047 [Genlisea aurea]